MTVAPAFSRSQAFSLMELCIVVAVMGVLAVLLSGALRYGTALARETRCLSNLRTVNKAALQFIAEHNGDLLPNKSWYAYVSPAGIRDYLGYPGTEKISSPRFGTDSVLTCPAIKARFPAAYTPSIELNRCYSINKFLTVFESTEVYVSGSPRKIANVPDVSRMWTFTDGSHAAGTLDGAVRTTISPSTPEAEFTAPHRERQNVVFLDGHAEQWTILEFFNPPSKRAFWGDVRQP